MVVIEIHLGASASLDWLKQKITLQQLVTVENAATKYFRSNYKTVIKFPLVTTVPAIGPFLSAVMTALRLS